MVVWMISFHILMTIYVHVTVTSQFHVLSLCPAGVDIPGYIALVQEKRYADAVRLIRRDNPMPAACALYL